MEAIVFITTSSYQEGEKIAKILVEEKLVACVNIIPNIESIYWWEDRVCEEKEVLLLAKTKSSLFSKIEQKVRELHSYEVPEIIMVSIDKGSAPYLRWIRETLK